MLTNRNPFKDDGIEVCEMPTQRVEGNKPVVPTTGLSEKEKFTPTRGVGTIETGRLCGDIRRPLGAEMVVCGIPGVPLRSTARLIATSPSG